MNQAKKRRRKTKNPFLRFNHELSAIGGQGPVMPNMRPLHSEQISSSGAIYPEHAKPFFEMF